MRHQSVAVNRGELYDVVVIGGGIYGLMISLEAGRAGLRSVVLERGTLGGATSANWFRILHGGLRYLQTLDVPRTLASAAEQRWFQRFAPDLVQPFPFLMPLYGRGMRRRSVFRAAFLANEGLTFWRNNGVAPRSRLVRGRVLDAAETAAYYPDVPQVGLEGGALWHDVIVPDDRQLIERLRRAAEAAGATIVEGVEAECLAVEGDEVRGVTAKGQGRHSWRAPFVVNAAGPWSAELAARLDRPMPELFFPSLAFNLLLDRPPPSPVCLAVSKRDEEKPTLFVYPCEGGSFVGTWYAPWQGDVHDPEPPAAELDAFLDMLNAAAPSLGARRRDVIRVYAGLLPVNAAGSTDLAERDIIHDHAASGGPRGLVSVSGVKFTTSRRVAAKVVRLIGRKRARRLTLALGTP